LRIDEPLFLFWSHYPHPTISRNVKVNRKYLKILKETVHKYCCWPSPTYKMVPYSNNGVCMYRWFTAHYSDHFQTLRY